MKVLTKPFTIDNDYTKCEDIPRFIKHIANTDLSDEAIKKIMHCRAYLEQKLEATDASYYGINTGFGYLQDIRIDDDQVIQLQHNLILSHACGVGEELPLSLIRIMIFLKIKALAHGHSGVRIETVERLLQMLKADILPVIYNQGSLGASGDLCPLSHMVLPLIGEGLVHHEGVKKSASEVLENLGWEPLQLGAKEGLALINGTQFMLAFAVDMVNRSRRLLKWANTIAAISVDAFDASSDPFHPNIQTVRHHKGQIEVASELRKILQGSDITAREKVQVQDPYSFRCIPQVHGATVDALAYISQTVENEINAVTDNPLIFPEEDLILSGGNFHGQPLALCLDHAAIAMSEIGNISERRIFQLLSGQRGLPLFLVNKPGLNSGLMIAQYTAASLVSENKQLSTPASVDSIVSSNGQEDHVSMGANAATKCKRVLDNVEKVLAIELLTACQALSFRRPLKSSPTIEKVFEDFRNKVSFNSEDRLLMTDIHNSIQFIQEYQI